MDRNAIDLKSRRNLLRLLVVPAIPPALLATASCSKSKDQIVFASPSPVWWNAVPLLTTLRGGYRSSQLDVRAFDVATGVKSKEAILDGNADVGICAANSLATSTEEQLSKLVILASITQTTGAVSIIAEGDRIDLENTTIGYVKGAISEFYLIAYLRKIGRLDLYKKLKLKALPPVGVATAFDTRDVGIAVPWEPFAETLIQACKNSNRKITVIRDSSLYNQYIYIVASRKALDTKRDAIAEFSKLIRKSCAEISSDRNRAGVELEDYFKFNRGFIGKSSAWTETVFNYVTDKPPIVASLTQDFELASLAGISQAKSVSALNQTLALLGTI